MQQFIVQFTRPNASVCFLAWSGTCEQQEQAFRFNNETAAQHSGRARIYGDNAAFWESERRSARIAVETHKGWTFKVLPA